MYARGEIAGRIGGDPDTRYTPDGTMVVDVSVAVKRRWRKDRSKEENDRAVWYTVTLWGNLGDRFIKSFDEGRLAKGGLVAFQCRWIEPEEYTKGNGDFAYKMKAEAIEFNVMVSNTERSQTEDQGYVSNRGTAAGRRRQDASYRQKDDYDVTDVPF